MNAKVSSESIMRSIINECRVMLIYVLEIELLPSWRDKYYSRQKISREGGKPVREPNHKSILPVFPAIIIIRNIPNF